MVEYKCASCKEVKIEDDFGVDVSTSRGRKYSCKECTNKIRRGTYSRKDYDDYQELSLNQRGCCAICKQPPTNKLYVDHDHKTNKVRGLLCHSCNVALGHFRDDLHIIQNALRYLKENAHEDA